MSTEEQIKKIIETLYPDEFVIVGEAAVNQLIESDTPDFYKAKGGSNWEMGTDLAIISSAVTIVKNLIDIYKSLHPSEKNKVSFASKSKVKLSEKKIKFDQNQLLAIANAFFDLFEK